MRSHKFDDIHDPPSSGGAFDNANYLHVDSQFDRIQKLAREDKIQAVQLNYKDGEVVNLLVDELFKKNISLGVLDLSNAWIPYYMKYHLAEVLLAFEKISKPDSVLFITNYARAYEVPVWNYMGFSYKTIKEYGFEDFAKILNENLLVVRNQKVVNLTYQTKACLEQILGELKSKNP